MKTSNEVSKSGIKYWKWKGLVNESKSNFNEDRLCRSCGENLEKFEHESCG